VKLEDLPPHIAAKIEPRADGCWMWTAARDRTRYGVVQVKRPDGRWVVQRAHRLVFKLANGYLTDGLQVDHVCRVRECVNPAHLREATQSQNNANRPARGGASRYKGVWFHGQCKAWCAEIGADGRKVKLGLFSTEEAAALAYNEAAKKLHGEFAYLNEVAA
jgi:hypothetical protein